uniref:Uncharacterized protein n=1 Tax=Arundo donax TaxID=35708 RepID=A0A0A8Z2A5_ARUDO
MKKIHIAGEALIQSSHNPSDLSSDTEHQDFPAHQHGGCAEPSEIRPLTAVDGALTTRNPCPTPPRIHVLMLQLRPKPVAAHRATSTRVLPQVVGDPKGSRVR